jgi:putative transposase
MIAQQFIDAKAPIVTVLDALQLPRSSYYYRAVEDGKKRGTRSSEYTLCEDGRLIDNCKVVEDISALLETEFVDYGYLKTTWWLRKRKKYVINPKKVYRLMRENGLLNKKEAPKRGSRNWVKELLPPAQKPYDYLEFDIKYMYISGQRRNTLLLTIIDVESRLVLSQYMSWKISELQVRQLFDYVFKVFQLPKRFYVRCDNGSQFVAKTVQKFFEEHHVCQEFCKPATPQQNAHIESYHSIVESVICRKFDFENHKEATQTMNRFLEFYNNERIHSGIDYMTPAEYLKTKNIEHNPKNIVFFDSASALKDIFSDV